MAKKRSRHRSKKKRIRAEYYSRAELTAQYHLTDSLIKKHFPPAGRGCELGLGKDDNRHYWKKSEAEIIAEDPYFRRDFAKVQAMRKKQQARTNAMRNLLLSYVGM